MLEVASKYYSVFAEPQRPVDRLPDMAGRESRFAEGATRYMGEYGTREYWIGADTGGSPAVLSICLVVVSGDGDQQGYSCADEPEGYLRPIRNHDDNANAWITLVPDGYEPNDEQASTWTRIAPNLYRDTAPD